MASARAVTPEASKSPLPSSSMPQSAFLLKFSDVNASLAMVIYMDGNIEGGSEKAMATYGRAFRKEEGHGSKDGSRLTILGGKNP